jgi:hypothetical protein
MGDGNRAGGTGEGARTATLLVRCRASDGDDENRAIDTIGGIDERGAEWHLPLAEAVRLADRGRVRFVLRGPARGVLKRVQTGPLVPLEVATSSRGTRYLRADAGRGARLGDLPECTHRIKTPPAFDETPLDKGCREAVAYLREHCPHLLPDNVEPGGQTEPVPVDTKRISNLVQLAAEQVGARAAGVPAGDPDAPTSVLWRDGVDALLVLLDTVKVKTEDGVVTVSVDVACDELGRKGRDTVSVDLVVGTPDRPTGMLVAAPRPRGPLIVTERWADSLVAFAWQAMIDASAGLGAALGHDEDGVPLVPNRWAATTDGISLGAQARHPIDRLGIGGTGLTAVGGLATIPGLDLAIRPRPRIDIAIDRAIDRSIDISRSIDRGIVP